MLGVRKTVPTVFVYLECGVLPLKSIRLIRIIKYWVKIIHLEEKKTLKLLYKYQFKQMHENVNIKNWAQQVKAILQILE